MRRRLARADDAADLFSVRTVELRPCMDHEDGHSADNADGLPPLLIDRWVRPRDSEKIVKDELRRFKLSP
jgi:hypothetical protein